MNGSRKSKALRTVRLADVLYDDQQRLVTLCRSCERHFITFESFQKHLSNCCGLKHIVSPTDLLKYDEDKRETRIVRGRQEVHIYDIDAVRAASPFDIYTELENPRWYIDIGPVKTKSDLAKENMMKQIELQLALDEDGEKELPAKRPRALSSPRRPILAAQQQRKTRSSSSHIKTKKEPILVPTVMEDLKRLEECPKKMSPSAFQSPGTRTTRLSVESNSPKFSPPSPPKASPLTAPKKPQSQLPMVSTPMDGTQKILNKLRACGVEVKRGNTRLNVTSSPEPSSTKNQQTLDIMRKLQSKGIKCTKVSKK